MNKHCDTCRIINSENDDVVVTRTKFWRVALRSNQAYLGQSFITLLSHKGSLSELSAEEWHDFEELSAKLENAIEKAFGASHFNWSCLMNEAYRTSDPVPHVHWHIFPRYSQKVTCNNHTFEDLEFGQHYINRQFQVDHPALQAIGSEIKTKL